MHTHTISAHRKPQHMNTIVLIAALLLPKTKVKVFYKFTLPIGIQIYSCACVVNYLQNSGNMEFDATKIKQNELSEDPVFCCSKEESNGTKHHLPRHAHRY